MRNCWLLRSPYIHSWAADNSRAQQNTNVAANLGCIRLCTAALGGEGCSFLLLFLYCCTTWGWLTYLMMLFCNVIIKEEII
jgi:hypothetical protein